MLHHLSTHFVLGFHGCDAITGEKVLSGEAFKIQKNDYDWLGHGIYFWEKSPMRGIQWAIEKQKRNPLEFKNPFVIGAILDLKNCLDLSTQEAIDEVEDANYHLENFAQANATPLPKNRMGEDLLLRERDCAVIEYLHSKRCLENKFSYDSVKGIFTEGGKLYENSGFFRKTHVQICIRNPAAIIGTFRIHQS